MSVRLSERTRQWLESSYSFDEVADDFVSIANTGIVILLSQRAISDLNRQAREAAGDQHDQ